VQFEGDWLYLDLEIPITPFPGLVVWELPGFPGEPFFVKSVDYMFKGGYSTVMYGHGDDEDDVEYPPLYGEFAKRLINAGWRSGIDTDRIEIT
jgi:hypothetical protein